jgi:hypothetical protein
MHRKPIELTPAIPRSFVQDMCAFFAEPNPIKRDEIAGRQMHALREYQGPWERPLKLHDVKEMFLQMRDQAS